MFDKMWGKFDELVAKYGAFKATAGVFLAFVLAVSIFYGLLSLF